VVVFGGHLPGRNNPIVYTEDYWETPLGALALDVAFASDLVADGAAQAAYRDFADNTVEIQLPFVKHFFPDSQLIAVHAPSSEQAVQLGELVEEMLQLRGLTGVYFGSADLTHYGPNYGFVPHSTGSAAVAWVKEENDRSLIEKALIMDATGLIKDAQTKQNTCSAGPIASVIASMSLRGVHAGKLIEYYTSYDIAPSSSFVGYAAIVY
jgi:AmmeMemoRadiSam system protein B